MIVVDQSVEASRMVPGVAAHGAEAVLCAGPLKGLRLLTGP